MHIIYNYTVIHIIKLYVFFAVGDVFITHFHSIMVLHFYGANHGYGI